MWRPHHSLFFSPIGSHSSSSSSSASAPSTSSGPLDLAGCADLFSDIELHSKQVEEAKKLLEGILFKLSKHIAATQTASDTGKELAEAFVEAGEKTKSWTDAGTLSESFLTTGNLLRSLELLRGNLLRSMQTQLRDVLDDFVKSEIAAAKTQKRQYDKARASLVAAEEKLRRAGKAGEPKLFELEKDRNVLRDDFIEVQQQTITTLTDTNGKLAVTGVTALCNLLDTSYEVYDRGHSTLDNLKPAIRDYRQSLVGLTRRDVVRRESIRRLSSRGESRPNDRDLPSPAARPVSPRATTQVVDSTLQSPRRPPRPAPNPGGGVGAGNAPQQAPPRPAFPPRSVSSNMVGAQQLPTPVAGAPMGRGQPINPPRQLKRVPSPTVLLPEDEVDYAATKTVPPGEVIKEGSLMKRGQKRKN